MVFIIEDREHLSKLFGKMTTNEILKDMAKTHTIRLRPKYIGTSIEYHWLTQRLKIALLEIIKREIL